MPDYVGWGLLAALAGIVVYLWLAHSLDDDGWLQQVVWKRYLRRFFKKNKSGQ